MASSTANLPGLLRAVFGLSGQADTFASRSFVDSWGIEDARPVDARPAGEDALWLVDTRDREGRQLLGAWRDRPPACGAALVLVDSQESSRRLREIIRRAMHPTSRRTTERRLLSVARGWGGGALRLGFDSHESGVPASFSLSGRSLSGAAYLFSWRPFFETPLWGEVRRRLGLEEVTVSEVHLRSRGAAVAVFESTDGVDGVLRVVPEGAAQGLVDKNHQALLDLRRVIQDDDTLLRRVPEPLLRLMSGSTLVLAETRLPGRLAWKLVGTALGEVAYDDAKRFLRVLHAVSGATLCAPGAEIVTDSVRKDLERVAEASFVSRELRTLLVEELADAAEALVDLGLAPSVSHGDFGPGNILVNPDTGALTGVIDWDTLRIRDVPGIDRVNLEIQIRRSGPHKSFSAAVAATWRERGAHEALVGEGGQARERALFGIAVCRYITRYLSYPDLYRAEEVEFGRALAWMRESAFDAG